MDDAKARALIDRYTTACATHDLEGLTGCYTHDVDFRDHGTGWTGRGPAAVKEYWQGVADATSDLATVIHRLIVAAEGFAYNWTLTGNLDQQLGPLPGDGQRFEILGTTIGTFRGDQIDTSYDYWSWPPRSSAPSWRRPSSWA